MRASRSLARDARSGRAPGVLRHRLRCRLTLGIHSDREPGLPLPCSIAPSRSPSPRDMRRVGAPGSATRRAVGASELCVRSRIASESLISSMETRSGQEQRRFRLGDGERVPDGVRRIARGQLDMSIERLNGDTHENLGTAVHETRKSLKRLRATVRLARDELGDEVYRRENVAFRDAAGRLGGARDSQVLLETLDALIDRHPDAAPVRGLRASRGRRGRRRPGRSRPGTGARWRLAARAGRPRRAGSGLQADLPPRPTRVPHRPPGAEHREPARAAQASKVPLVRGADRPAGRAEEAEAHRPAGPRDSRV
jgi:hypothetical protein